MTREVLKENWHIIEAFKNGAEIQYLYNNKEWCDTHNIEYLQKVKYRIKPKPEYIPFDYSDAEHLIYHAIKHKDKLEVTVIICIQKGESDVYSVKLGNRGWVTFDHLLYNYTFLNGSPCGKLKEKP